MVEGWVSIVVVEHHRLEARDSVLVFDLLSRVPVVNVKHELFDLLFQVELPAAR